jgi:hypothetical protein
MTESEWLKSGDPILHFEHDRGWPSARRQRLFAVACCRRLEHLLADKRWGDAIEIAERYADRRAKRAELFPALAELVIAPSSRQTHGTVRDQSCGVSVRWACEPHRRKYGAMVAVNAAAAVAYAALPPDELYVPPAESPHGALWYAAERAEKDAQLALLYEVCGDPFRPIAFLPEWRTSTVLALARQMYESRDFAAMPILADALQDDGCTDDANLTHCRGSGPHVRGCWVVDGLLNKG